MWLWPALASLALVAEGSLDAGELEVAATNNQNLMCGLSKMEEDIAGYKAGFLPTIAQLRRSYPGEHFAPSTENSCQDVPHFKCEELAGQGACNGTFTELERVYLSTMDFELHHKETGFWPRYPDDVSARQIEAMQV